MLQIEIFMTWESTSNRSLNPKRVTTVRFSSLRRLYWGPRALAARRALTKFLPREEISFAMQSSGKPHVSTILDAVFVIKQRVVD